MIERLLWGSTTVRIWFDELPDWETIPDGVTEIVLAAPTVSGSRVRRAAMENRSIAGGRSHFGTLGAAFTPDSLGQLFVQIPYTDHLLSAPDDSFSLRGDIHSGLYHEYVDGVLTGVRESDAVTTLGPGKLIYSHGQHGLISSSRWTFRRLARCVLRLLACDDPTPSDGELTALVGNELKRINNTDLYR